MGRHARLAALLYGVAAIAYLLDRFTKSWAESSLATRPPIEIIPGVFHLSYTTNSGGAFGIGESAPLLFAGASAVVIGFIVWASFRLARPLTAIGLGLVLGGAVGNLTDRLIRGPGLSGRVIDFLDFRIWPVFNLADAAIVIGAALLAWASLRREEESAGSGEGGHV